MYLVCETRCEYTNDRIAEDECKYYHDIEWDREFWTELHRYGRVEVPSYGEFATVYRFRKATEAEADAARGYPLNLMTPSELEKNATLRASIG